MRVVNRSYDIPYIAGDSVDRHTVSIDRHVPRTFRWLIKTVRVEPFLLTHEIVEKALLDELRLHYLHAHQIAVRAELRYRAQRRRYIGDKGHEVRPY